MKFFYTSLVILFVLLSSNDSFCQDNRYIEINVSDTVHLKPIDFQYKIALKDKSELMSFSFSDDNIEAPPPLKIEDVIKILQKNNFKYVIPESIDYNINKKDTIAPILHVNVNSETELKKLHQILKELDGINGELLEVKYESPSIYMESIYKSLYNKAKKEAETIAKISGCSILNIISIEESKSSNDLTSYIDMFQDLFKSNPLFGMFGQKAGFGKDYVKKMNFKFAIK